MPRKKRPSLRPARKETPEAKAARIARLAAHRFKPGQTGNPTGKNGVSTGLLEFRSFFREKVAAGLSEDGAKKVERVRNVLGSVYVSALNGNNIAQLAVLDRMDMTPPKLDKLEVSGPDGGPVQVATSAALSSAEKRARAAALMAAAKERTAKRKPDPDGSSGSDS